MADPIESTADYYTPYKGKLQLCQSHQSSERSHTESILTRLRPRLERSYPKKRLGSEPEQVSQDGSSTSKSCYKSTLNFSRV